MATVAQRSFAGGEIAPSVYARVDQTKYATGLRTCRNFVVMRHGGVQNRPGTAFVAEVKDSTKAVRLIPFIFNNEQTYVLEFGELYMRVHKAGGQLTLASKAITLATSADPVVITAIAHGYTSGDEVTILGVGGTTELNNRNFKLTVLTPDTFSLQLMDGTTDLDGSAFGAYSAGGTSSKVFEIATPYLEADLPDLQFVQSADVVTLVHPGYAPRDLSRSGDTAWSLDAIVFTPTTGRPNNGVATQGGGGTITYRYQVVTVAEETRELSLPGLEASRAITAITQALEGVISIVGSHSYLVGDKFAIAGIGGMVEITDGDYYVVAVPSGSSLKFSATKGGTPIDTTLFTPFTAGGTMIRDFLGLVTASVPTVANPHTLTWDAVAGAQEYNVYREVNGVFGFVGIAGSNAFSDDGILQPDTIDTPPQDRNPFDGADNHPSTVTYFQQRRMFANTNNKPETVYGSKTGAFKNFTVSSPLQDDDAVTFTLAGRQVNSVNHLIDLGGLVVFTQGGEWTIDGDTAGILQPGDVNPRQISYNGSGSLSPLIVGNTALYVQGRGSIVRDLGFDFAVDTYRGNDLTIFAAHLVDDFTLKDWAFQQIPHSVVWAVRSDGTLLGLTYVREHEVFGWHRHDFDGLAENVAVVSEGTEDALYLVIKRTVDGKSVRYIERMKTRQVTDIVDSVFSDSALTFDGRTFNTGQSMTLSGGTTWVHTETLTLTAGSATFTADDVGNGIHLTGSDGTLIRFVIGAFSSSTVVTGKAHKTVPVSMRTVAISDWCKSVDEVGGLWHLEGKEVSILADGFVVGNPNNSAYDLRTVADGKVALGRPYCVIHVGLPITADLETLDIDTANGESIVDKKKLVNRLTIFVEKSRGIFAGRSAPTGDDPLEDLQELKIRNEEGYEDPVNLATGVVDMNIEPAWNSNGRIFIRQSDPLPLAVLAVAPAGNIPFRR